MILHARAREPEGPDRHDLFIRFSNDPEWTFNLRTEEIDGTLAKVTEGDVHFVIRKNPRTDLDDCPTIQAEQIEEGIWVVRGMAAEFDARTRYQLDHIHEGRRTTHAYGIVVKEDNL